MRKKKAINQEENAPVVEPELVPELEVVAKPAKEEYYKNLFQGGKK